MKDKLEVVKIGGNVIDNPNLLEEFLNDFAQIEGPKILVHGGGKLATQLSEKLDIPVQLIDGRRITSPENLDVVTMVYGGLINKRIVAKLVANGCNAIGLSGADGNSILATKRSTNPIDFGMVGDVQSIQTDFLKLLLDAGITPVFCAISHDGNGQLLNTNADTVTAEIAIAMQQFYDANLMYCFEKPGVLKDVNDLNSVLLSLNKQEYEQMKEDGSIHTGMLPKLKNCFYALENKVQEVKIGNTSMVKPGEPICTKMY